ncbi:ABC transporter substrate-binding protein [Fictibacillus fluitans]|uniref:Extracellular solute-binding protein n=1 Tax=Fictibacillus fluitans TaxID=3058422 RepID=A0ABT8HQE3_9BACL|nr:extracellular solute-binding protein [Fictibacillus sp. NE201]MDN4522970.1 extracellular solute-binding protein [Fictibacillus sp. NE201]
MNTFKKGISLIFSIILITGLLTGCNSGGKNANGDGGVTLKLLMDNSTNQDGIRAVADAIEKKYNIKTEISTRPGGTEGDNVVKTRLATGDMDDLVFYNSGSLLQALNPAQNFVDLTNEPYMKDITNTFKKTVTVNKKIYGIPGGSSRVGGWLYNKKVYKKLGLSVPKTWKELMANNKKIKAAGKTAVIGTYKDDWTSQLIYLADNYNVMQKDPEFPKKYTEHKATISNSPAALRSFEKLEEVYKKGYMNKDFLATTYDNGLKMLAEGKGAHYPMLSSALTVLNKNYPDKMKDIGIFPQPGDSKNSNGFTTWMPSAFYINKNGSNVEAAKKWVKFFVSSEGLKIFASKDKPEGPFVVKNAKVPKSSYPAVKEMLPYFDSGKTGLALEFISPVKGPSLPQITTEVGSGNKTAKAGAAAYDKDVEKQAKQLGLSGW